MENNARPDVYDVIVIGNGPAGLSAAINVRQRNGSVLVIGLPQKGSLLYRTEEIDNYPGLEKISGKELLEKMTKHAADKGADFVEERVLSAILLGETWMVSAGPNVFTGRKVIFAGGVSRGKTYPGEDQFLGRGVSYCATCDGMIYKNKKIVVIGYSDADQEEVDFLKGLSPDVHYFRKPRKVTINGEQKVSGLEVDGEQVEADGIFILRPALSPSSIFPGLELENGYIKTDENQATNLPGLYAAGDCTGGLLQVAKAVGEGLIAGQAAMKKTK
ncbi:MAG: FAD-dependent oxidoreductase [Eubacterium sp.]|nr:FAD-dependent oxidoreductase [Eubacterium sp.]